MANVFTDAVQSAAAVGKSLALNPLGVGKAGGVTDLSGGLFAWVPGVMVSVGIGLVSVLIIGLGFAIVFRRTG
jgi:hypothetical protein